MDSHAVDDTEVRVGELRLAARVWGPAEAPPVIALHGWLDNAASFERLAPLLGGLRIVALDLPGHGHSEHRPPGCWYHLTDYVADVLAAADDLGLERFSLLGHSLGGAVATLLAAARPERILRLGLIEALGPLTAGPDEAPGYLAHALRRAEQAGQGRQPPVYADLRQAVEARRAAGGLSTAAARLLVERGSIAAADGVRWRSDPRLRLPSPFRFTEDQTVAFLAAIAAPTMLITAEAGLLPRDRSLLERRTTAVADLRVQHLQGNHHLHLEDPEPVAAVLRPFLAGR